MKNFIVILFFLFFFMGELFAKEVRTRFGFYINIPNNYVSSSANMDDLLKESGSDVSFNKEYLYMAILFLYQLNRRHIICVHY